MERKQISAKVVELKASEGCLLHRIGSETDYSRQLMVAPANVDEWEEVAESEQPSYTRSEYNAEVERLIAERYTTGQEIQFAREKEQAGEKFADYLAFVEVCKQQAKENLSAIPNS